jgi:hypothetical protein
LDIRFRDVFRFGHCLSQLPSLKTNNKQNVLESSTLCAKKVGDIDEVIPT